MRARQIVEEETESPSSFLKRRPDITGTSKLDVFRSSVRDLNSAAKIGSQITKIEIKLGNCTSAFSTHKLHAYVNRTDGAEGPKVGINVYEVPFRNGIEMAQALRRSSALYGVPLIVDGQPSGVVSATNPASIKSLTGNG